MGRPDIEFSKGNMRTREPQKKPGRVMVFGVFDGLHEGHRAFLAAAKKRGAELVVVVARDSAVRELKRKTPRRSETARAAALRRSGLADRVVLGDKKQGTYRVIARWNPGVICLGYDQDALAGDLRKKIPDARLARLAAHQPERWKTSLLRK